MQHRMLLTAAVIAAVLALPATAAAQKIQPGESIVADGSFCTLNWIYDGQGAQAARSTAAPPRTASPASARRSRSRPVRSASAIERIGQVAFVGNADEPGRDYAFIEIDAEDLGKVNPALKGHPAIPTGVSTHATARTATSSSSPATASGSP